MKNKVLDSLDYTVYISEGQEFVIKEGIIIKKYLPIMLLCCALILSACTQLVEDTPAYSGIIVDDKVMGYEYTVTKEGKSFFWKVGYKGDLTTIEESTDNEDVLQNYMMTVSDIKLILSITRY